MIAKPRYKNIKWAIKVIRKDGTVEDLGIVAEYNYETESETENKGE